MIFSVLNMPFSVFPSAARFCSGPIKIFHGGGGGGGGGSGGGGGGGGGGSGGWRQGKRSSTWTSGEHVGFDTWREVLEDAEGRRLTVLDLSNSQEWLNRSLDGRT